MSQNKEFLGYLNTCIIGSIIFIMAEDHLWDVIHSLNPEEKRYFKRDFLSTEERKAPPLYLKIFEVLEKAKAYKEADLLNKLSPGLNKKNLPYNKNYLFKQIQEALFRLHTQKDRETEIFKYLKLIRVFRKKGLYQMALKLWVKAIKSVREMEYFPLNLQLLEEYRKLQLYNNPRFTQKVLESNNEVSTLRVKEYVTFLTLQEFNADALAIRKKGHFRLPEKEKRKIDGMLNNPLMKHLPDEHYVMTLHYFYHTKATLLYLKGDSSAYSFSLKDIETWLKNTNFIKSQQEDYLESLYIFYYSAVLAHDYSRLEQIFSDSAGKDLVDKTNYTYYRTLRVLALNRIYNALGTYDKASWLMKEVVGNIALYESNVNIELKRTLFIAIGIASFALEKFEDSYYFINKGLLLFNDLTRKEHHSLAYLFLLIICYEMKEAYLFDIQYAKSYAYFYRKDKPLSFERNILKYIKQAFGTPGATEKKKILEVLYQSLARTKSGFVQQQVFSYFDIPNWLQSKIHRVAYKDWVRRVNNL